VTRPVKAVGMEANIKMIPIRMRAPNLSHIGPLMKRMKIVPSTEKMLDVQISCLVRPIPPSSGGSLITGMSGAMANQMKKAVKKALISVALSSWLVSTARW